MRHHPEERESDSGHLDKNRNEDDGNNHHPLRRWEHPGITANDPGNDTSRTKGWSRRMRVDDRVDKESSDHGSKVNDYKTNRSPAILDGMTEPSTESTY